MTIQERIAELVAQHGSLREVSRVTRVEVGYLSRLRSGEKSNPKADTLRRIGLRRVVVVSYEHLTEPKPSTITIDRSLLEQALEVIVANTTGKDALESAIRAELAKPVDIADEMSAVADQFAHRLALDLECVLADYQGTWYDTAINTLGAYRGAMNAIHERVSPTFMGEPLLPAIAKAEGRKE